MRSSSASDERSVRTVPNQRSRSSARHASVQSSSCEQPPVAHRRVVDVGDSAAATRCRDMRFAQHSMRVATRTSCSAPARALSVDALHRPSKRPTTPAADSHASSGCGSHSAASASTGSRSNATCAAGSVDERTPPVMLECSHAPLGDCLLGHAQWPVARAADCTSL